MIFEILLLALASTVRPTSLAAVTALLSHESRKRLMFVYIVCGLAFTVSFGVVVVGMTHGIHLGPGDEHRKGVAELVGGVAALIFGVVVLTGHPRRRSADDVPVTHGQWLERLDRRLTIRTAAIAGPLTHIPGLFYLVALNLIVAHNPRIPGGVVAVVIYDVIWFAVPLVAFALCIVRPAAARGAVVAVAEWTAERSRAVILVTSFGVGAALVIRGALTV